ncbi:MAG TPA: protein kinase [Ktedonobacteraceae bacterium]|nr:protein kinase [Ktedonobacteraceae bacterium]
MIGQTSFERLVGVVLGNYRLEQLVEQDRWGAVFVASANTNTRTGSIIRFISTSLAETGPELKPDTRLVYLGRFQQEANQVSMLQHPHILPLLDYGSYRGMPYLVYSDISRMSLRTLLAQSASTDLLSVGRYLEQIASALEYAHERAVLHRNLSTNCIFVMENRQLSISEFGLIRMVELSKQFYQIEAYQGNTFEGSSESSSPEQLLGKAIDTYADIYAMGAILYRLLTGQPPFLGNTRDEIIRQHLYAAAPSLSIWRPGLPVELDHIVAKALAKEPLDRYHTPGELVQAYYQIVAPGTKPLAIAKTTTTKTLATRPLQRTNSIPLPKPTGSAEQRRRVSRRRLVTLAGAGAVAALATAALFETNIIKGVSPGPSSNVGPKKTMAAPGTQRKNFIALAADLPVNSAKKFSLPNQDHPGLLIHLPDKRFVAFSSICTHAGCAVAYSSQDLMLICPCHDAIFDPANNAAVVQGPAPAPLPPIKIVVNADGTITAV